MIKVEHLPGPGTGTGCHELEGWSLTGPSQAHPKNQACALTENLRLRNDLRCKIGGRWPPDFAQIRKGGAGRAVCAPVAAAMGSPRHPTTTRSFLSKLSRCLGCPHTDTSGQSDHSQFVISLHHYIYIRNARPIWACKLHHFIGRGSSCAYDALSSELSLFDLSLFILRSSS